MDRKNEIIQWVGAVAIIAGHASNTAIEYGYNIRPLNIAAFAIGTIAFLTWALRTKNKAQTVVNVVSLAVCSLGLVKAFS